VAAKDFDMARQWAQEGVRVTGYSDLASRKVGEFDSVPPVGGVARGVGVGGGAGEEIDMGEAVVLDFKTPQTQLNVGLRDLYVEGDIVEDGTETASWAAYKDGKVVAQGTADGTTELNQKNNGTGLAEFKVDVPGGMDQLIFYSAERGSDFHVEFVEATNPNGCGSSSGGGSAAGSSGGSRSSGGGSSGSGSRSGICDVIADCVAPPSGCRYVRTESPGTCPITCGSLVCDGNELPVDPAGPRAGSGSSAGGPDSGSGSGSSGGGSSGSSTRPSSGDGPSLPRTNGSTFYVSPSGSDSVSCAEAQNTGTPMRTIKAAVRCLQAGDTLYIRGGTYDEEFTGGEIPSGTSWSNPVIIAAYPGESVTLRPSSGDRVFTFVQPQQYIILDGLIMDASNVRYDAVKITCTGDCSQNANHIRIQNSEIKNAANQGILGGVESEFINLDVHDNGRECGMGNGMYCHGIYIASGNNLIEGSRFYNNSGCGIHLYNGSEDGAVHDNIVSNNQSFGNGTCGIVITSGSGNKVYGNTVYNNDSGIDLKPTVCPSFDPCCIT
jgi:parallel beta-helix repeat protein